MSYMSDLAKASGNQYGSLVDNGDFENADGVVEGTFFESTDIKAGLGFTSDTNSIPAPIVSRYLLSRSFPEILDESNVDP